MKKSILGSLLCYSVLAPTARAENTLSDVSLRAQGADGASCLSALVAAQIQDPEISLYNFEGPFERDGLRAIEYRAWATRIRAPGYVIRIVTADGAAFRDQGDASGPRYTAAAIATEARVYEFLRGGEAGPYEFSIDLTPCAAYLK